MHSMSWQHTWGFTGLWMATVLIMLATGSSFGQTENWTDFGGKLNPGGGWFDWVQNDIDGRYCARTYKGHVQCWDAVTNTIETVWTYDPLFDTTDTGPRRGDLQVWGWDPIYSEYIHMDGGRSVGPSPWAFSMITKTWRRLTNSDFAGIETRSRTSGAGSAMSRDHNLFVVFGSDRGNPGRRVLIYDLVTRTYHEALGPEAMPLRKYTQQQFVYVPPLRQFLLFGGMVSSGIQLNDLWLFDPVTEAWTSVPHLNPPSPRHFGQMVYHAVDNAVYLTGGHGGDGRVARLSLETWIWEHFPLPSGTPLIDVPGYRRVGASIVDPLHGWCLAGGTLAGGTWQDAAKIWCLQVTE